MVRRRLVLPYSFFAILTALSLIGEPQGTTAALTYPPNGASNVDLSKPFQWTTAANVQAYYLYVGTTVGANNLVNTGEKLQTSYPAPPLPGNQTLYARMWTKAGGNWSYTDTTFSGIPVSRLTYPLNGASNVNLSQPFQWTTVGDNQAYYLYVGTTVGGHDLVNTGETQQLSYRASALPAGQTLHARMWTKVGGVWRYTDSTFTAAATAPLTSTLTYPANGAVDATTTEPFRWTAVHNAQSYYLYVGTTAGANNVVNTGETQATSYRAMGVPGGQTLYARIWTKVANVWRYTDSTFTALPSTPVRAQLLSPANGADGVKGLEEFSWTAVEDAQGYYLYVGSSVGANDIINSGSIQGTSYSASGIPAGEAVYVRLWTVLGGVWRYVDSTFTTAALSARLIHPAAGAAGIDQSQAFSWTEIPNAEAYYLYIGTTPGGSELFDSGATQATSLSLLATTPALPSGQALYARLWTQLDGIWRYRDSTFTAAPLSPRFLYPTDGAVGVNPQQPFAWMPPAGSQTSVLRVGTSPGGNDVFDSAEVSVTSLTVNNLPATGTVYARVLGESNGVWRHVDIAFTVERTSAAAAVIAPVDGQADFDTVQPIEWTAAPLARGYRLTLGTAPGAADLHDSGVITVTRRFVPNLPAGTVFGRLDTRVNGEWIGQDFTFTVAGNMASSAVQIESALWATHLVREMALSDNRPFTWTALANELDDRRPTTDFTAFCNDYAETLLRVLVEMNLQLQAERLDVALNPNNHDAHTLVELRDPGSNRWMLLDPTFGMTVRRTADQAWATAEDMSAAANAGQWNDISYEYLGPRGDFYARRYYLDYPLLFVNVYHSGEPRVPGAGGALMRFMEPVALPVSGPLAVFAIGCSGDSSAVLAIDGAETTVDCSGVDGLSYVFGARTIAPADATPGSVTVYRPRRFVF